MRNHTWWNVLPMFDILVSSTEFMQEKILPVYVNWQDENQTYCWCVLGQFWRYWYKAKSEFTLDKIYFNVEKYLITGDDLLQFIANLCTIEGIGPINQTKDDSFSQAQPNLHHLRHSLKHLQNLNLKNAPLTLLIALKLRQALECFPFIICFLCFLSMSGIIISEHAHTAAKRKIISTTKYKELRSRWFLEIEFKTLLLFMRGSEKMCVLVITNH